MTDTGGRFIDETGRKPLTVDVDGTEYEVKTSEHDYDLEVVRTSDDVIIGYIARLDSSASGFVAPSEANLVLPAPYASLEDGIRHLLTRPATPGPGSAPA
ncbi:hypothetical protein [Herbiconiux solani]|uniref:hypothetical protein n=1 Tax=Herbiconiux solani TaxID=661329 RepID=UPI0008264ABC|nr:hypothetical protein [Herbiconiux solani]